MAFGVVSDLLSSVSLGMEAQGIEITLIPRSQIEKNPKNKRSINDIMELAQDICMCGLEQPLVVYQKEDGSYRLLTGERRLTAIDTLIREDRLPESWPGDRKDPDIPCIVKDLEEYKLPLSDDLKEKYAIQRTNRFNRKPTDSDIMRDYTEWKEIITELKKNGYTEFVAGTDEDGREITQSLKGRTREIAQKSMSTHVSTGQLAKIDVLLKKGVPELLHAVEEDKVSIAVAETISHMPLEDQRLLLQAPRNNKIEKREVDEFLRWKKHKQEKKEKAMIKSEDPGNKKSQRNNMENEPQGENELSCNKIPALMKAEKAEIIKRGIKSAKQQMCILEEEIQKDAQSIVRQELNLNNIKLYHVYEVRIEAYELLLETLEKSEYCTKKYWKR